MKICSICQKETDSEPYDVSRPVICEDCKFKCKDCGTRVYGGGHIEYCNKCYGKNKKTTKNS